ncbi:MAG: alkaline phosphatase family protein [Cyanobacteria bacterium P01_A01_bin.3]
MKNSVIAIGLDSADPDLMEQWIAEGHLPNLQKLIQDGTYGRIRNTVNHADGPTRTCSTERLWSMAWSGCRPDKTGFWDTSKFFPDDYSICRDEEKIGVNFAEEYPPFYAFLGERRVAAFDLPASGLCDRVNGKQILGWGGHYPFTPSHSTPDNLLPDLIEKYGENDVLYNDHGFWGDPKYAQWLSGALNRSVDTRTTICRDLLNEEDWDLFVAAFPEPHSGGHDLLHLTLPDHPVYPAYKQRVAPDYSPVLDIYKAVDRGVGQILEDAPDNSHVVCFSVHGMGNNITDALSMVMLPETIYRWNFPGKQALAPGVVGSDPGPGLTEPNRNSWQGEIWNLNHEPNPIKRFIRNWLPRKLQKPVHNDLVAPWLLAKEGVNPSWMPTMWYSRLWPQMKAFALPSFADGHIRINLKGRERDGVVLPEDYDAVCDELIELLNGLVDARTGETVVDRVVRTRKYPTEDSDRNRLPGPDLVVLWKQNYPTDVVDSPQVGRVGPVPCPRPGGHKNDGFVIAKGSGIEPGSTTPPVEGVDIGPTILTLLGASVPKHLDGEPISTIVSAIQVPAVSSV